jgi:hypothetical protein
MPDFGVSRLRALPHVDIKAKYLTYHAPPAKGEGVGRADWPKELQSDFITIPDYTAYLDEHKNKKGDTAQKYITGVGRAMGFLEITLPASKPDMQTGSVEVLIALYTSGNHMKLLKSPLLDPKYFWSAPVMSGLALYCEYHIRSLTQRLVKNQQDNFEEYTSVLKNLMNDLTGGYQKRCSQHKATSNRLKQQADLTLIKQINIPAMQAAVLKGYMILKAIEEKFGDSPLTKNVRGHANAAMAGGIAFDTFSGRKMEWERLLRLYVIGVLHANGDHLVCSEHKTSMTYGSIAKLLTPGLFQAFLCYSRLHFPDGCKTFLVPATKGARTVCLPSALKSFCSSHLPAKSPVWPTFNLQRKLFHRALMLLTEDKEKMKELMVVLDAHSKKVQGSHYILRDPADDVILAVHLVKAVLGVTVVWPSEHAVEENMQLTVWLEDNNANDTRNADQQDEFDSEDEELEHFEGAEIFGDFTMPAANATLTPLSDICSGGGEDSIDTIADGTIVATQITTEHSCVTVTTPNAMQKQNKKDKKDKKDKTDKKDKKGKKEKKEEKERKDQKDKEGPPPLMIEDGRTDGEDKDEYAYVKSVGGRRTKVDPCAHEYMRSAVREWQTRASKTANDKPYANEWYWDLRIELIKKGMLSRNHSQDVCRSYIKKWVTTQPDTLAPAVAADVPEHEDAVVTTQPYTLDPAVAADVPEHEDSLSSAPSAACGHAASAAA